MEGDAEYIQRYLFRIAFMWCVPFMSIARDLTRPAASLLQQLTAFFHPYPCLPDTTTDGVRGAGSETTGTKTGIGTEIGTAIHVAGAAAPAVAVLQDGVVPSRGGQVCAINRYALLSLVRK